MADALAISAEAVSNAPFGTPVVPEVDTTTATSSSIGSSARSDVVSSCVSRSSSAGTGRTASAAPASAASRTGTKARAASDTDGARRTAIRDLRFIVTRVVQRPALGSQALPDPLDVVRRRQLVGDSGDEHADVDVVELTAVHQILGHGLDLVIGESAVQQGH